MIYDAGPASNRRGRRMMKGTLTALLLVACSLATAQYVEDSIDVGGAWVGSMCYNSSGADVVYGLSNSGDFVFAIDCSSNQVVSRVDAYYPRWLTYDSIDNKLYCTFGLGDESLLVLDGSTHQPTRTLALPDAALMAWDPVANRLFVSCTDGAEVVALDCATDSVIAHIPVGNGPLKMHLNTQHRKLYVQNDDESSVSIVGLDSNRVISTVYIGGTVAGGYYSAAADKYYCDGQSEVVVISGSSDSIVGRIALPQGSSAKATAANEEERLVLLGIYGNNTNQFYVVDSRTDSVIRVIPSGDGPSAMLWSTGTRRFYCANNYSNDVSVVAGDGSAVLRSLPVGAYPFAFAYSTARQRLYVGHLNYRWVFVIRDEVGIAEERPVAEVRPATLRAWPNPFEASVRLEAGGFVNPAAVAVYSADGRLVRMLERKEAVSSRVSFEWNGRDAQGRLVGAGVYMAVPEGGARKDGIRMVKMR